MSMLSVVPNSRSLTVIVMDVSPVEWGKNDEIRDAFARQRQAEKKPPKPNGPCLLEDLLSSVQAFASAYYKLERDSALLIVAVAANDVAVVYPRKDHLEEYFSNPSEATFDIRRIREDVLTGVIELMARASKQQKQQPDTNNDDNVDNGNQDGTNNNGKDKTPSQRYTSSTTLPAMASGFSIALCLINRFMVAAHSGAGVSALHNHHTWERGNGDDAGIILAMGGSNNNTQQSQQQIKAGWSPRIFLIQNSADRPDLFNAMMNCTFAAIKQNVIVDGCFLSGKGKSSPFLQQATDMSGGIYMAPNGKTLCGHYLTEFLLTIYLPSRSSRNRMKTTANDQVDFRARAFDTDNVVKQAYVCNQCLSIFENKHTGFCPTCGAEIKSKKRKTSMSGTPRA